MDNAQWLQWRRNGVGASDAPVIMGVSPWKTPYQLWMEKITGNSTQKENSSMERGKRLESEARDAFSNILKTDLQPKNVEHDSIRWLRASLDGIDPSGKIMVEIKCPNKNDHFVALNKMVPEKYWPQLQHQMLVTGLDQMYYVSYTGEEIAWVNVKRDPAYVANLLEEEQQFWDCVLNQTAPDLTEKDYLDLENVQGWSETAARLLQVQSHLKELEVEERHLKTILMAISGERNARGGGLQAASSLCKGVIDYKQAAADWLENLRAHHPELNVTEIPWEAYRKAPYVKWTFRSIA